VTKAQIEAQLADLEDAPYWSTPAVCVRAVPISPFR
jgi:hypothetical protein